MFCLLAERHLLRLLCRQRPRSRDCHGCCAGSFLQPSEQYQSEIISCNKERDQHSRLNRLERC